jgi:hypothetical protein
VQAPVMFVWVSLGSPDNPPDRLRVESCHDCGSLVRTDTFDRHGRWHARSANKPA